MHHVLFLVQVGRGEDGVFRDAEGGGLDLGVEHLDQLHLLEGHGTPLQLVGLDAAWVDLIGQSEKKALPPHWSKPRLYWVIVSVYQTILFLDNFLVFVCLFTYFFVCVVPPTLVLPLQLTGR